MTLNNYLHNASRIEFRDFNTDSFRVLKMETRKEGRKNIRNIFITEDGYLVYMPNPGILEVFFIPDLAHIKIYID